MRTSVPDTERRAILTELNTTLDRLAPSYPGESDRRQPVHTVYGGAHRFRFDTARRLGDKALAVLREYASDPATLARALGLDREIAELTYPRVVAKLEREPVEDFRLDFEDGYGHRPDAEEDACAVSAADEVARALEQGTLPPFIGIRIKSLGRETAARGLRTLDLFVTRLLERTRGVLPGGFAITLPKVITPMQVTALVRALTAIESHSGLPAGALALELMVETTQSIFGDDGQLALPALVAAAAGRCVGAHFGVYDHTASCSITAQQQHMGHPACESARQLMLIALAGRGVALSDGATNVLPVPVHRSQNDAPLTMEQRRDNEAQIHRAWRHHFADARHSLETGFYQGWDLHPAQLVSRYAAVYSFFLDGLEAATTRLRNFVEMASQATLVGDVFDDAATGQGLLNFFLRGWSCGALTDEECLRTGLSRDELLTRSFPRILDSRRRRSR
ncbi:MAG: phosphoenolpyruvate kinase [Planctomycetota bacterium]